MQDKAQAMQMVMAAPKMAERSAGDERWPLPVATLFVIGTSVALWTGIIIIARVLLG